MKPSLQKKSLLAGACAVALLCAAVAYASLPTLLGPLTAMMLGGTYSGGSYNITAVPNAINALNEAHAGFVITGGTPGYTYAYTVASSGGTATLSGAKCSGTVSGSPMTVPGFNVSGLAAGTLTYSATLTDSYGNVGTAATASAAFSPTTLSNYVAGQTPAAPFTFNNSTGAVLMDVGSGTITAPASLALSGSVAPGRCRRWPSVRAPRP